MGVLCGRVCVGVKAVRVVVGGGRSEIAGIVAPQNGGDAPARLRRSVPPRNPPSSKWDMTAFKSPRTPPIVEKTKRATRTRWAHPFGIPRRPSKSARGGQSRDSPTSASSETSRIDCRPESVRFPNHAHAEESRSFETVVTPTYGRIREKCVGITLPTRAESDCRRNPKWRESTIVIYDGRASL